MNVRIALVLAIAVSGLVGCEAEEQPYTPKPAVSGRKANLPSVPSLPTKAKKVGDAYTIYGATHDLRSRVHSDEINGKKTSIVGYIVKTNYASAPECAVHKTGKGDTPDCKAQLPTFAIADDKGETKDMIDVMGWASNFAQVYSMLEALDKAPAGKEDTVKLTDEFWSVELPNPLPSVGAKVKVTGTYGMTFSRASGGAAANPKYGIMSVEKIEYLEPSTEKVVLPGMKKK